MTWFSYEGEMLGLGVATVENSRINLSFSMSSAFNQCFDSKQNYDDVLSQSLPRYLQSSLYNLSMHLKLLKQYATTRRDGELLTQAAGRTA
ncbi:hypothetical protein ABVT39_024273 [Epinephelus coioides]